MTFKALISIAFLALCVACGSSDPETFDPGNAEKYQPDSSKKADTVKYYSNPVWKTSSCADPSVLRVGSYFYCYSTDNNCNILRSTDLVNWTKVGTAFTKETRPCWRMLPSGDKPFFWAPDCEYVNGKYHLYYSISASDNGAGIGVAVSDSPEGPFVDKGPIVQKDDGCGTYGNIDQFYWEEGGVKYLIWGSFSGIFISELSEDGLSLKYPKSSKGITKIAGNGWEGSYIYKKNGFYYYFGSHGTCCDNENSTYNVQVARGTSIMGPFYNKKGEDIRNVLGTYKMLGGNDYCVGPGHNAEIQVDDNGDEWFIYHGYVKGHATEYHRVLFIDKLTWDAELWPVINNGNGPTSKAVAPYFK